MARLDATLVVTTAGVVVALFIGAMQIYISRQQTWISRQQTEIAQRQAQSAKEQGEIQAVSSWLPFLENREPNVRYMAVLALERLQSEAAIAPLAAALSDQSDFVRERAATALSHLPSENTIDILVSILAAQDPDTANAAIETLQRIGHRSLPALEQALVQASPQLQANARRTIERILLNEGVLKKIGAIQSHAITTGNPSIKVAIVGAGVDTTHAGFRDTTIVEFNHAQASGKAGRSTTMSALLIVGRPRGEIVGVAPNVTLISERVFSEMGGTSFETVVKAVRHATAEQARIIYLELSGSTYHAGLQAAIREAHAAGALIIAAAGNENSEDKVYPAAMDHVLAVAATDMDDHKADYSSYGAWIDISAPGNPVNRTDFPNSMLGSLRGTSFSGALVAGAVALVWSVAPDLIGVEIESLLLESAHAINAQNPDYAGKLGTGRLDVAKAISRVQSAK